MEKLKKFNHVMFAVMSIIVTIVAITLFTSFVINKWPRTSRIKKNDIISKEEAQKLFKENKRKFMISFRTVSLIDSVNQTYLIPISQKEMEEAQKISKLQYMEISSSEYYYSRNSFNNLVIYSLRKNLTEAIFSKRICIVDYKPYTLNEKKYLFIIAGDKDTNLDGLLNNKDMMDIYIYDISKRELQKVSKNSEFILSSRKMDYSNSFLIKVGIDRNNDKKFLSKNEPTLFKRFNVENYEYKEVLNQDIYNQLQDILDGKTE